MREKDLKELKQIPNCLSKYRRQKGLTQKEAARVLRFRTSGTISKWERGASFPSTPFLLRLSALYGRPVEALFIDLYQRIKVEVKSAAFNKAQHE